MDLKSTTLLFSGFLFILLVLSLPLTTTNVSALGPVLDSPLRPEWLRAGDYVTYLESVTAQGVTETIHVRETIIDDSGTYINGMRIERFGEKTSPNFPSSLGHLQPSFAESTPNTSVRDEHFLTTADEVAAHKPAIELVRGMNNKTYEAYRLTCAQIYDALNLPPSRDCGLQVWFEKETLIKVKLTTWSMQNGINRTYQQLIEDSNIQGLATASSTNNNTTSTTPARTVTTTIFARSPQIVVTTTTTITVTETRNSSENTTAAAAIPITAGIVLAGAVISIALLKRRVGPS